MFKALRFHLWWFSFSYRLARDAGIKDLGMTNTAGVILYAFKDAVKSIPTGFELWPMWK